MLTDEQVIRAGGCAVDARANFVKTSTGFGPGGTTVEAVGLMYRVVQAVGVKVKASGGTRTLAAAQTMIAAGASRLGVSAGVQLIEESNRGGGTGW